MRSHLVSINTNTLPQTSQLTFTDCMDKAITELPSENSRNSYLKDIRLYLSWVLLIEGDIIPTTRFEINDPKYIDKPAIPHLIESVLLAMDKRRASHMLLAFKGAMQSDKVSENTINRRIAAIKWFYRLAYQKEFINYTIGSDDVKGYKVTQYRDTRGVSTIEIKQMLDLAKSNVRDTALLRLLFENALRRDEISKLTVKDFLPQTLQLRIFGKGKGQQCQLITISPKLCQIIKDYLATRGELLADSPLFVAQDNARTGVNRKPRSLSGDAISKMVARYALEIGIDRRISAHRIRHTSITASLVANKGDIPKSQKLSRHARPETLMRYWDNQQDAQGEMSNVLSELLE